MIKNLFRKFLCFIGDHAWTCKAEEGVKPNILEGEDPLAAFNRYATMYCKYCRKVSDIQ